VFDALDVGRGDRENQAASEALWTELALAVTIKGGLYAIELGADAKNPIPAGLFASKPDVWLGLQVSDDPELPRVRFGAVPYAAQAAHADSADTAKSAESLTKQISGDLVAPGSLGAAAVGFTYAGSNTKGGPAMDLDCTGCVDLGELAPGVLSAGNVAYDPAASGLGAITVQGAVDEVGAALAALTATLKVSGGALGVGKTPAGACVLDVKGGTCEDGAPVFMSRIVGSQAELDAIETDGLFAYRSDNKRAYVRMAGTWRRITAEALCGDANVDAPEACDDGAANANAPDKCRTSCKKPACGDNISDSVEECDDGNKNDADQYTNTCKNACKPCSNGSCTDCNPGGSALVPSSVFVDAAPPDNWTQCAGFINTNADDVSAAAFNNCTGATKLRMRIWDSSGALRVDVYENVNLPSWPNGASYIGSGGLMLVKCDATLWPCGNGADFYTSTNGTGGGGCSGYASGGPTMSNGNGGQSTVSPADSGGKEIWQGPCYGNTQWINYKMALYR